MLFSDHLQVARSLAVSFPFDPTEDQKLLFYALGRFLTSEKPRCTLVVKGYAGTGKTSVMGALVKTLRASEKEFVLLAPTGRAAKVLAGHTDHPALTIHKHIYLRHDSFSGTSIRLAPNKYRNAVFIVDEASMIAASTARDVEFGGRNLLDDLIDYVFSGRNCRLVLIGDGAQLPPVGTDHSPALDYKYLLQTYDLTIAECELTEVMRQSAQSDILTNATFLRHRLSDRDFDFPYFNLSVGGDLRILSGNEMSEALDGINRKHGTGNWLVITRSNKQANIINRGIRQQVLWLEEEISSGDLIMVVKNNYYWLARETVDKSGFIANGDILLVERVFDIFDALGFRFARVRVRFADYVDAKPFETILLLTTLYEDAPALTAEKQQALFEAVKADLGDFPSRALQMKAVAENAYFNALQVKFAYAVTCHKSQGGQWPAVFVEKGYLTDDMLGEEYLRWLYTAITRARTELFLVNFEDRFFQSPS